MQPRITLAWLLALVAVCALGLAALVVPSQLWASMLFGLTLAVLVLAAVNALYSRERTRAFWVGFLLSGGVYFAAVFGPWTSEDIGLKLGTTALLDILYAQIAPPEPQPQPVTGMAMMTAYSSAGMAGGIMRGRPTAPSDPPPSRWSVWTEPDRMGGMSVGQVRLVIPEPFRWIGHSLLTLVFATLVGAYAGARYGRHTAPLRQLALLVVLAGFAGAECHAMSTAPLVRDGHLGPGSRGRSGPTIGQQPFLGVKGGDECEVRGVKLCWCPPGRFLMGSPAIEAGHRPDEAQVEVTLTRGFWAGKYEVTQGRWRQVMGEFPAKQPTGEGDDFPVVEVNYAEAEEFCRKLTEQARAASDLPEDWEFRLPTEAQWEYACRAGTTTATAFGDKLSSTQVNFQGKPYNGAEEGPSLKRAARVGSYPANAWGLHDMHGNIFEWCRDWYHQQLPGGADPDLSTRKGTMNRDGTFSRVRRGGAWNDDGWACRSAFRLRYEPERRSDHIGFRVVAVPL